MLQRALRVALSLAGVAMITYVAYRPQVPTYATTVGFAYLLLVLIIASTWGFVEAALASVVATLTFNFFFLPPLGTFTIGDPQNLVAFVSFLITALIASRLSALVKRRAQDAIGRQQDLERLYTFSRAILLIDGGEPFPKQLIQKLAETFNLNAVVLYDRHAGEFYRAGPEEFAGMDDQLRDAALLSTSFSDPERQRVITAIRLGAEPIASLALQGARMPDSVLQGIANLIAIGLERARSQNLARQVEAARESEQLRTTLIDAMAHEFKTPLTSIKAATTSLLSNPEQSAESRTELLKIADEEAEHLHDLIDDAVEMARLDTAQIQLRLEPVDASELIREVVASLRGEIDGRPMEISSEEGLPAMTVDRRLVMLAVKQVLDNALKYSTPSSPVSIRLKRTGESIAIEIVNRGKGIPGPEQKRIFERFYRSPSIKQQIPGSGLGLSIVNSIVQAHHGELTLTSTPAETAFRMSFPVAA
ncbi:MAG TPA: ATP-binding protein [Bryobacteraceae bacterium]|nr:ATP-binding protein [Bryobacteraceae bacterium]